MLVNWKIAAHCVLALVFLIPSVSGQSPSALTRNSFVYQGRLQYDNKTPRDGDKYDLSFSLYGAETGGTVVGTAVAAPGVPVYGGVFVVNLDFGASVFNGTTRWMQISARKVGEVPYSVLSPRQPITFTPQALYALTVADGAITAAKISGFLDPTNIPGLDSSKIVSGNLADTRLTTNVALLNRTNVFTGAGIFNGVMQATNVNNQFRGTFTGNGAGLAGLNAANVTTGVLDPARVPSLNASKITDGTLADERLSSGIARSSDVDALRTQVAALNAALAGLVAGTGASPLADVTYVSAEPEDAGLLARGLRLVVRVPAPAWVNGSTANAPSARSGHSGVWTGQEWILWGGTLGRDGNGVDLYASTGGRYQPDADAWTPVSTVSAPAARSRHAAVWSGSEMIVWGGYGATDYLADGARFSLGNNRWNRLSASPLTARDGHWAVWTGDRMLVWGGNNRAGRRADGALYNPADNTWTLLPTAGAPAGRANATVLWAGDRLLVWGGDGVNGYLADGAQLLFTGGVPASTWQALSAFGAPAARSGHTGVWTGTRMLVWGGENGQGKLGDGAAYDPLVNAWTPLPTALAPVARKLHSAIWTDAEMIIYGGATATGATSTGAAYNPALNRWRVLTNPGTPAARQAATAVWTGSQGLFFGGANSNGALLAALQRLDPQPAWYFFRKP